MKGYKRSDLLSLIDNLKQGKDNYAIALVGEENGNYPIVVVLSKKAIDSGLKAGMIVRNMAKLLGGSGGGKDEMASGAGKNNEKIEEALALL